MHVHFGGVIRRRWPVHGPAFRHELGTDGDCVRKFAAVTFARVIDEWLCPTLRLRPEDVTATGVELQFVDDDENRLCGVSVDRTGDFVFHPTDPSKFEEGARVVNEIAWSATSTETFGTRDDVAILRCHLRLTPLDDDTWGCAFRREILANVVWSRTRIGRAADAMSRDALTRWATRLRREDDKDDYALAVALIDDVREFLRAWPRAYEKDELRPWKRLVTEVVGRDVDVLLAFCPRWITLGERRVSSTCLDPLGPTPDDVVSRVALEIDEVAHALRKPRFSPKLMVGIVDSSRVACAPDTVLRLRSGKETTPTHFYVDETCRDDVASFLRQNEYDLRGDGTRRYCIAGVSTRVDRWIVDHRVIVEYVSRSVLERFDHHIVVAGQTYGCQRSGLVATHAIARLMKAAQEGRDEDASELADSIEKFHANTQIGFPLIDGHRRKKRVIYFSDYDREFTYRADKSVAVPVETVPINYTRHMHERLPLGISV